MKKIIFILIAICLTATACKENKEPDDEPISIHDLITANLLKQGTAAHELLTCDWVCVKFAYTEDGNTIVDGEDISQGIVKIPDIENVWLYYSNAGYHFDCLLNDNLINFTYDENRESYTRVAYHDESTYNEFFVSPQPPTIGEMADIFYALSNAYSFVIIEDELIIYFTGVNDKNLMVLKNIEKDKTVWICDEHKEYYSEFYEWRNFVLELTFYPSINMVHLKFINPKEFYLCMSRNFNLTICLYGFGIEGYSISSENRLSIILQSGFTHNYLIEFLSENSMIIKGGCCWIYHKCIRDFLFIQNTTKNTEL